MVLVGFGCSFPLFLPVSKENVVQLREKVGIASGFSLGPEQGLGVLLHVVPPCSGVFYSTILLGTAWMENASRSDRERVEILVCAVVAVGRMMQEY